MFRISWKSSSEVVDAGPPVLSRLYEAPLAVGLAAVVLAEHAGVGSGDLRLTAIGLASAVIVRHLGRCLRCSELAITVRRGR
jgi:hypothetical protein